MAASILHGDNEAVMADLAREGRTFALAYLDPPFLTQRDHTMPDGEVAFSDRWKSLEHFVAAVTSTAHSAWSLVVPGGALVVHLDPKTSHYVKVAVDGFAGRTAFASEIVWRYRRWPTKTSNFQRVHDVLLRWVRPGAEPRWVQLYEPLSAKTVDTHGRRKQRASWDNGKAHRLPTRLLEEESPGAPMGDVWDIGIVGPSSDERNGYPTQKPEALLARLLSSTTLPGDHVLDPYMGSGTTLAVCQRLGRHAVGIDASPVAIRVATERLAPLLAQRSLFDLGATP